MIKRMLCAMLTLCLLTGSLYCAHAAKPQDITPLSEDEIPENDAGQFHYLLACTDTWDGNAINYGNTDGVLMVTMDTIAHRVMVTTFTREMLVKRPDGGIGRFTFIYKNFGADALCKVVSTHFGVKVDKYVIFNMNDIQTIIDAMGGVNITVTDAEADYLNRYRIARDATTPSMGRAGTYLFSGHAAVIYMRIRKVGGDGDSGRTRRIRTVLSTLAQKYRDVTLDTAFSLLGAIRENMITTNLSYADMFNAVSYAVTLRNCEVEGLQMPPQNCMKDIVYAGMQTREVDFERSRAVLHEFLSDGDDYDVTE